MCPAEPTGSPSTTSSPLSLIAPEASGGASCNWSELLFTLQLNTYSRTREGRLLPRSTGKCLWATCQTARASPPPPPGLHFPAPGTPRLPDCFRFCYSATLHLHPTFSQLHRVPRALRLLWGRGGAQGLQPREPDAADAAARVQRGVAAAARAVPLHPKVLRLLRRPGAGRNDALLPCVPAVLPCLRAGLCATTPVPPGWLHPCPAMRA